MSIYTPEQQQRMKDAANIGAKTVSTGYIYGIGNQTAQDQMNSPYNNPNAVHQYNGTIATDHAPVTVAPAGYTNPGVMGDPNAVKTATQQASKIAGGPPSPTAPVAGTQSQFYVPPAAPGNVTPGGVAPATTPGTTPPPTSGPPQWYNSQESQWQNSLDQAENYRNYNNAYTNYANDQSHWLDSQGNPYNGSQGDDHTVDWAHFTAPTWSGADAYGLAGVKSGQAYDDPNQAQVILQRVRQFDPNAQIVMQPSPYESGGSPQYTIQFDQSKLPALANPQADTLAGPYGHDHLYNNDNGAMVVDPHYGVMTNSRNIKEPGPSWLDYAGMAAMAAPGFFMGGAPWLAQLGMALPGIARGAMNGASPLQLAASAIPLGMRGFGVDPMITSATGWGLRGANYLYNQNKGG